MVERKNLNRSFSDKDFRFTQKGKNIYAICMGQANDELVIRSLKRDSPLYDYEIEDIGILGTDADIEYEVLDDGLHISIPESLNVSPYATTVKIIAGELMYLDLAQ